MSAERQEERWTAERWGLSNSTVSYRVTSHDGDFVAYIDVPPGDEGRATVAKMVAALQWEALARHVVAGLRDRVQGHDGDEETGEHFPDCRACVEEALHAEATAALQAAKRLP